MPGEVSVGTYGGRLRGQESKPLESGRIQRQIQAFVAWHADYAGG